MNKISDKVNDKNQLIHFSKCNDSLFHNSVLSRAWSEIQIATKIR